MLRIFVAIFSGSMLLVSLAGCGTASSIPMKPVSIKYVNETVLTRSERPESKTIRVAQFVDKRPIGQIEGSVPPKKFLLLYFRQAGPIVTGNGVWRDENGAPLGPAGLGPVVTTTLRDSLEGTNYFDAVSIEPTPNPTGGSGLILNGEIESLYAEQMYKKTWWFLLLFWGSNVTYGTPRGHCKLNFWVVDGPTNREIYRNWVKVTSSDSEIVAAGQRALRDAETRLVNDLTRALRKTK